MGIYSHREREEDKEMEEFLQSKLRPLKHVTKAPLGKSRLKQVNFENSFNLLIVTLIDFHSRLFWHPGPLPRSSSFHRMIKGILASSAGLGNLCVAQTAWTMLLAICWKHTTGQAASMVRGSELAEDPASQLGKRVLCGRESGVLYHIKQRIGQSQFVIVLCCRGHLLLGS